MCRARRVSSQCTPVLSCRRKMGRSVAAASEPRSRMHAAATCRGGTCGEGDAFGAWHGHIFPCKCLHVPVHVRGQLQKFALAAVG